MQKGILFVAATRLEVAELISLTEKLSEDVYANQDFMILISGVGLMHMSFALSQTLHDYPEIKQVIHIGIAGDYLNNKALGTVYQICSSSYGDLGTQTDKGFQSFYDDGLLNPNHLPFENAAIKNYTLVNNKAINSLPIAHCVTLNSLSTNRDVIQQRKVKANTLSKEDNYVEHMECLAVFFVCSKLKKPFISLLATSNRVGDNDKKNWEFNTAISNLSVTAKQFIAEFQSS